MPLLLLVANLPSISFADGITITKGWLDTYHVMIVPFVGSAFSIFLFYQFFLELPKELDEAAMVDGATRFQIFYKIIVPISGPVFADGCHFDIHRQLEYLSLADHDDPER